MIRTCPKCRANNRIPPKHLTDAGKCGKCKSALPPVDVPYDVPDGRSFDEVIANAKVPVLVDFWAVWCGPCKMVAPEVKKAAQALAGRGLVLKVDTDRLTDVAARFQVTSIPTFIVFRGGAPVLRQAGAVRQAQLLQWVDSATAAA
jgi:thioredoxin 2